MSKRNRDDTENIRSDLQATSNRSNPYQTKNVTGRNPRNRAPGPLFFMVVPFAVGIYTGWTYSPATVPLLLGTIGFFLLSLFCYRANENMLFLPTMALFMFFTGNLHIAIYKQPPARSLQLLKDGTYLEASGHVENVSRRTREGRGNREIRWSRSILSVHTVTAADQTVSTSGSLYLYTFDRWPSFKPGDVIEVEGKLSRRKGRQNPGSPSWKWYRVQQEAGGSLVLNPTGYRVVSPDTHGFCTGRIVQGFRHKLRTLLRDENRSFSILPALLLGMRDSIDPGLERMFQESGTIHFLAVSGLHVFFLMFSAFYLLRCFHVSPGKARFCLGLLLVGYLILTGFRTSTLRATIMASVLLAAFQLHRTIRPLHLLGLSAWIILFFWPLELFSPGFQFSFLAVFALVLFAPMIPLPTPRGHLSAEKRILIEFLVVERFKYYLTRAGEYFLSLSSATLVVIIFIGPLIVQHFHLFSPASLLTNPIFYIMIPVLLGAGAVHLGICGIQSLGIPGFGFLSGGTGFLVHLIESILTKTSRFISETGLFHLYLPEPGWGLLFVYWAVILFLYWKRNRLGKMERYLLFVFSGLLILLLGFGYRVRMSSQAPSVTVLDVGHGNCIFLEDRTGKTIVYDCGSRSFSDPGQWTAAPALWKRGKTTVDLLIISHPDQDHISGVRSLLKRFRIKQIWVTDYFDHFEEGKKLLSEFKKSGHAVRKVSSGTKDTIGDATLHVLSPPARKDGVFKSSGPLDSNASSLVLSVKYQEGSVLLTGDLEGRGKAWFQRTRKARIQVDLLQVPHHGGAGSARESLAGDVVPRFAVISAGRGRIDGNVYRSYRSTGAYMLDTVRQGAIKIYLRDTGPIPTCWRGNRWVPVPESAMRYGERVD